MRANTPQPRTRHGTHALHLLVSRAGVVAKRREGAALVVVCVNAPVQVRCVVVKNGVVHTWQVYVVECACGVARRVTSRQARPSLHACTASGALAYPLVAY